VDSPSTYVNEARSDYETLITSDRVLRFDTVSVPAG